MCRGRGSAYHEEKADYVIKTTRAFCGNDGFFDFEAAGSEEDGEGDPESAVGGESCSTECVANSHFPMQTQSPVQLTK